MREPSCVFVVDDDASSREAIQAELTAAGLQAETFGCARDFLNLAPIDGPSCLVLDMYMPDITGLEVQRELSIRGRTLPIVFVSGQADIPTSVRAIKAGAIEFLVKPFDGSQLVQAVTEALMRSRLMRLEETRRAELAERFRALTARQREVMRYVVAGLLNKQIAHELGISEITVKIHRRQVMKKMKASSLADLVRIAEQELARS